MIETDRLLLRAFLPEDLPGYAAIRGKPSVARYLPGDPAAAAARLLASGSPWSADAWSDGGYAPWAVIEKSSRSLIGHLGLRYLPEIGETELLYMLDEPWWGQGIATEGGRAALGFARDRLRLRRLVAFAVPENLASLAVMRRLGFQYEATQAIFGLEAVRFGLALAMES